MSTSDQIDKSENLKFENVKKVKNITVKTLVPKLTNFENFSRIGPCTLISTSENKIPKIQKVKKTIM